MKPALEWSDHTHGESVVGAFLIDVTGKPNRGPWRSAVYSCKSCLVMSPMMNTSESAHRWAWNWIINAIRPVAQAEGWVK